MSLLIKANKEIDSLDAALEWIIDNEINDYAIMDGNNTVINSNFDRVVDAESETSNFNCTNEDVDTNVVVNNNSKKEICLMANQFVASTPTTVNVTIKSLATRLGVDPLHVQGFVTVLREKGMAVEVGKLPTTTGKGRSAAIYAIPTSLTLELDPADSVVVPAAKPAKAPKAPKPAKVETPTTVTTAPVVTATPVEVAPVAAVAPTVVAPTVTVEVIAGTPVVASTPTVTVEVIAETPVVTPVVPTVTVETVEVIAGTPVVAPTAPTEVKTEVAAAAAA